MKAASTLTRAPHKGKLFYRINEVAKMTGLKPYVLRYWEGEFPELCPSKDGSDQRRYRQADIDVVLAIRKLLYEDRFTIEGARKRLRDELRQARGQSGPAKSAPEALVCEAKSEPKAKAKATAAVTAPSFPTVDRLDQTLRRLRKEVNDLIGLLG